MTNVFCEHAASEIEANPWLCQGIPTGRPTPTSVPLPTWHDPSLVWLNHNLSCIHLNDSDVFEIGRYIIANFTINGKNAWMHEISGDMIYWSDRENYGWIVNSSDMLAVYNLDGQSQWESTPPVGGRNWWTVYSSMEVNEGEIKIGMADCSALLSCVDSDPFCSSLAANGNCYSNDNVIRENMLQQCMAACGSCDGSMFPTEAPVAVTPVSHPSTSPTADVHSCDNGKEVHFLETGATCCTVNITNSSSAEVMVDVTYAYFFETDGDVSHRLYTEDFSVCSRSLSVFTIAEIQFGPVWWYWGPLIFIGSTFAALFLGFWVFKNDGGAINDLLSVMAERVGVSNQCLSDITKSDIKKLADHWAEVSAGIKFEEHQDESDDPKVKVSSEKKYKKSYQVLKKVFQDTNVHAKSGLDTADFYMALSSIGVAPTLLDIEAVFSRLNDGSGYVSAAILFEAIKNKIKILHPRAEIKQILAMLRLAILNTFTRERRRSLSILRNFEEARKTSDGSMALASMCVVDGLIKPGVVRKLSNEPEKKLLTSHEFNRMLISMGVPFSEELVLKRVLELQSLQPNGIDADEFEEMLQNGSNSNHDESRSDAIIRVLEELIVRHGGYEAAAIARAEHHAMEADGACISYYTKSNMMGEAETKISILRTRENVHSSSGVKKNGVSGTLTEMADLGKAPQKIVKARSLKF